MSVLRPYRIVVIGHSLADLKEKMKDFIAEVESNVPVTAPVSQGPSVVPQAIADAGIVWADPAGPFGAPPPMPHIPEHFAQAVTNPAALLPPTLPAVPTASTAAQYDAKGMPWDERIHSATAAKTKDGAWRYRRGVEDSFINTIEAELKSQLGQPVPAGYPPPIQQPPVIPPAPVAPPAPQVVQAPPVMASPAPALTVVPALPPNPPVMASQPVQPVGPASAPAPAIPQPVVIPAAHSFETFKELFIPTMGKLVADRKIDQAYVNELKKYFKVEQLWELNDQQKHEMFETFVQGGLIVRAT